MTLLLLWSRPPSHEYYYDAARTTTNGSFPLSSAVVAPQWLYCLHRTIVSRITTTDTLVVMRCPIFVLRSLKLISQNFKAAMLALYLLRLCPPTTMMGLFTSLLRKSCTDRVSVYIYDDYFHFLVAQKLQKHLPLSHDTHI